MTLFAISVLRCQVCLEIRPSPLTKYFPVAACCPEKTITFETKAGQVAIMATLPGARTANGHAVILPTFQHEFASQRATGFVCYCNEPSFYAKNESGYDAGKQDQSCFSHFSESG